MDQKILEMMQELGDMTTALPWDDDLKKFVGNPYVNPTNVLLLQLMRWHKPKAKSVKIVSGHESDGFHTFDELYEHRNTLYVTLCRMLQAMGGDVWRSQVHADGTSFKGWFILGIGKDKGKQITYHLPEKMWEETSFAETLEKGHTWDGHTPEDVLPRLKAL